MQIGEPLRTVVVEPLEVPAETPTIDQPEPEPSAPQPEPERVPAKP